MKIRVIELNESELRALQQGYMYDASPRFRQRCQIIILKSQAKSAKQIAQIVSLNQQVIYRWLNRYEEEGIEGLRTRKGQGRKCILNIEDEDVVRTEVAKQRQRLKVAHEEIQQQLNKDFSTNTLKRFLKNLGADLNE